MWFFKAQREVVGQIPLIELLNSLGGWPVLETNWNEEKWNMERSLGQIKRLYTGSILIRSAVAVDDKNSTNHLIQVKQQAF